MRRLKNIFTQNEPISLKTNLEETQAKKIFSETILKFQEFIEKSNNLQNSLQQIYLQYVVLNKEINANHNLGSYIPNDTCLICFHPIQEKQLKCGHFICEKYDKIFRNLFDLIKSNLNNETIQNSIKFCYY
ncbi:elfless isoform b [Anaeramoeba ignava]|uniref:Elfless isoform b n=1 Tax=Anaeramoeba ignava TaxID=1746090 RepID=A0A9Q0LMF6_ANAIG|nr:elfless isoform b [Anaeramoeba ignava]